MNVYFSNMPMILLRYKKTYLNTNDLDHSLPNVCVFLLQDFKDIFPDEIPYKLPPIKEIGHQINLVFKASIPNQKNYKSNPKKIKELQRQVNELMIKKIYKKNMSSCVVLVLLVQKNDET